VCVQRDFRYGDFGAHHIVTCRAVYGQRFGKHVPAATDTHATIEVLLETKFSTVDHAEGANQVSSVRESKEKSHRQLVKETVGNEPPFRED
jgi:hypothetical protein